MSEDVGIARYVDAARGAELDAALDAIFFAASNTRSFADDAARAAFREQWLGRYLSHDPQFAYVALTRCSELAGYLVGAIDDPAKSGRFDDIAYFRSYSELMKLYPAHLHVNLAPAFRNRGIGKRLIDAFTTAAKAGGAPGMHVVTSANSANVRFYNRCGFAEAARLGDDNPLVFLARRITA